MSWTVRRPEGRRTLPLKPMVIQVGDATGLNRSLSQDTSGISILRFKFRALYVSRISSAFPPAVDLINLGGHYESEKRIF